MKVAVAEQVAEVQRYLSEVLGSEASFFDEQWCIRNTVQGCNAIHPMLPNSWFSPQDSDVKKVAWIALRVQAMYYNGDQTIDLPDDLLDLRGVNLQKALGAVRVFYDYGKFAAEKANMGDTAVPGLSRLIVFQDTNKLRYWPPVTTQTPITIDYITRGVHPSENPAGVGYFSIAERARPIITAWTAARGQWADMEPAQAQALAQAYKEELAMAIQMQAARVADDPFRRVNGQ